MTGLIGFASGYKAMKSCDVLLVARSGFSVPAILSPKTRKIAQIDVRPEALGNRCPLEVGVLGSVKETLKALTPQLSEKSDRQFLDLALADYKSARADLDALAESKPSSTIDPSAICHPAGERTRGG